MEYKDAPQKIQITSNNNSLVLSWKYPIEWYIIAIPHGSYTIEQLNEQIHQRVSELTGEPEPAIILFTNGTVFITSPRIIIDIYQSNIRTVIGWPEHQRETNPSYLTYGNYSLEENLTI